MKLQTLIIDDEPIALEKLHKYVEKVPYLELAGACRNGIEATAIMSQKKIDVVFTDINMPDMSGLEFIGSLSNPPLVVFITAYAAYAVDSYKFSAVDYLLKPYGFADFQRAANKVLEQHTLRSPKAETTREASREISREDSLFIKVDHNLVRIGLSDIRYIKAYGEYLQVYTIGTKSPLLTLSSLGAIKEKLSQNFLQIHRSYIVNMERIQSVSKGRVIMDADTDIPIGDSFRADFQNYISSRSITRQ